MSNRPSGGGKGQWKGRKYLKNTGMVSMLPVLIEDINSQI